MLIPWNLLVSRKSGSCVEKILEVLQTEVMLEAEVEAPLVERQANRVIGGIDEEETKRDERR